jgi:hypothetical protein
VGPPSLSAAGGRISAADLAIIRKCLPNIKDLSDDILSNTPMETLLQFNQAAAPTQPPDMQVAMYAAAAAAAAQFTSYNPAAQDPGVKMAKNLEMLRANPLYIPEGHDDRFSLLHDARFLAGAVASGVDLWRMAREVIPLEGYTPLANYDLDCIGLGGSVTAKGCLEAHNPGSTNICLKMFSPENLSTTAGAARKFTIADDDGAVSVGEHMKEITEMNALQHAMRVLCALTRLIMPWNLSYCAIDGFLYSTNYGFTELGNDPLRVAKLVKFVNYALGRNAAAWQRKEPFLTTGALKQEFGTYLQCQASGAFVPAAPVAAANPPAPAATSNQQQQGKGGRGGKFSRPFYGGGFRPYSYGGGNGGGNSGGGYNSGGQNHGGGCGGGRGGGRGGGHGFNRYGYWTPSGYVILCRNFNMGTCKNNANNCKLPSGARAHHYCSAMKANGDICKEAHPECDHS